MSSKPDHKSAKEFAEWDVTTYPNGTLPGDNLARAYLDLVKQHGELRAAIAQERAKLVKLPTYEELPEIFKSIDGSAALLSWLKSKMEGGA